MDITGLILAGGRGVRMGALDKGLQLLDGITLIRRVVDRLAPQVVTLMINANRNLEDYLSLGLPVWPDQIPDFAGPLAGFQTGLMHCDTPYMVTAPCDCPFLPADLVAKLHDALIATKADLAYAETGADVVQPQPVFCLMRTSLQTNLSQFLQDGGRKVDAWFATLNATAVHFDDDEAFCNVNTVAELQRLSRPGVRL